MTDDRRPSELELFRGALDEQARIEIEQRGKPPEPPERRVRNAWRMRLATGLTFALWMPGVLSLIAWLLDGVLIEERVDGEWRPFDTAAGVIDRIDWSSEDAP